jgi:Flp pilus assembly protein TadD
MNSIPRLSAHLALLGLCAALTACGGSTSSGVADARPATRPLGGAAMLQQVRSAGEVGDELDVQPLRDPRVEDLRASATQAESRGDYAGASRLLAQAAQFTPNDPDLLQWQAELALVERDWAGAERLATQSWDHGPKLGGLCRRNWTTRALAAQSRSDEAAAAQAQQQVAACKVAPPVRL